MKKLTAVVYASLGTHQGCLRGKLVGTRVTTRMPISQAAARVHAQPRGVHQSRKPNLLPAFLPKKLTQKGSRSRRPTRAAQATVGGWCAVMLWCYVVLLGLVLPFICWGSWGTPGHPHAGPHLVFHHPPSHGSTMQYGQIVPRDEMHEERPVGRSAPDTTSVISLVIVPLLLAIAFTVQLRRDSAWLFQYIVDLSVVVDVPTPPPRHIFAVELNPFGSSSCRVIQNQEHPVGANPLHSLGVGSCGRPKRAGARPGPLCPAGYTRGLS